MANINKKRYWEYLIGELQFVADSNNISQKEIAKTTGIKEPNVCRFFRCKTAPNLKTFIKICEAVDIRIALRMENES